MNRMKTPHVWFGQCSRLDYQLIVSFFVRHPKVLRNAIDTLLPPLVKNDVVLSIQLINSFSMDFPHFRITIKLNKYEEQLIEQLENGGIIIDKEVRNEAGYVVEGILTDDFVYGIYTNS